MGRFVVSKKKKKKILWCFGTILNIKNGLKWDLIGIKWRFSYLVGSFWIWLQDS